MKNWVSYTVKHWIENYLKKNEKNSKNYLHNYMLDIRDLFNKD